MKYFLLLLLTFTNLADLQAQSSTNSTAKIATRIPNQSLVLLGSNFLLWETYLSTLEVGRIQYSAVYYDSKTHKFFHATMDEIEDIKYTFIPSQNSEIVVEDSIIEPSLLYVGNILSNQRVLVNTNRNKIYIKTLTEIKDNIYSDNGDNIFTNTLPVFPILNTLYEVQYTNDDNQLFNRVLSDKGRLRLLGTTPDGLRVIPAPVLDPPK